MHSKTTNKDCPCQSRTTPLLQQACLCCCYMCGDFLIGAVITSPSPVAGDAGRGLVSEHLAHSANRVPKPGGGFTFGRAPPRRQFWEGGTASDPIRPLQQRHPLVPSSAVKMAFSLPESTRRADAVALPDQEETAETSDLTCGVWPVRPREGLLLPLLHRARVPPVLFYCGKLSMSPLPICKSELGEKVSLQLTPSTPTTSNFCQP